MRIITSAITALAIGVLGVAAAQPAAAEAPQPSSTSVQQVAKTTKKPAPKPQSVPSTLAGRVVDVSFDNGAASTLTFSADGKQVSYVDVNDGSVSTVAVSVVKNAKGLFLVTWYEPATGYTVSHLQNYNTGTLSSTWTYLDPATGQYVVEPHQGTLKLHG
ncbi:MoaF-related domain-containing protein [Psychromicrobium lacuslunae]|uniref:MoaF-related domain-containing protein n=1 Tax=Psychromicrobium lacuslunae TaxID=1618207 RepID=UPI000695DAD5|nr:hypothetical protein [Psychromicrobium lacuslunae]